MNRTMTIAAGLVLGAALTATVLVTGGAKLADLWAVSGTPTRVAIEPIDPADLSQGCLLEVHYKADVSDAELAADGAQPRHWMEQHVVACARVGTMLSFACVRDDSSRPVGFAQTVARCP